MKKSVTIKIVFLLGALGLLGAVCSGLSMAGGKTLTYHYYAQDDPSRAVVDKALIKINSLAGGKTAMRREKQTEKCLLADDFILDRDYAVTKWTSVCPEEGTDFTGTREGAVFVFKGTHEGESLDKTVELGNKPLHVFPNYSLEKFAVSELSKIKFLTFRRDTMETLPMQAIHKGEETILVNGKEVRAIKIYYSIDNRFKQRFYNRDFYYRKSDGLFIKKVQPKENIQELVKEE